MGDPLLYLTYFTAIVVIGLLTSIIANKIKLPNVLLLVIAGIILGNVKVNSVPLIDFPVGFTGSIAILALVMIVFDSTSRLSFKSFDTFSARALELTGTFLFLNLIVITIALKVLYGTKIILGLLFAALMSGTAPDVVLSLVEGSKNRVLEFLKIESILNTPVIVVIPFMLLELVKVEAYNLSIFATYLKPFLLQIVAGAGTGLILSIIVFKVMRKYYSENLSPLAIISTSLLSYTLAENLGGNGVLSVTVAGLIFANVTIKGKVALLEFSKLFSIILEILVFVFVGLLIKFPFELTFVLKSLILFVIYLFVRFISVSMTQKESLLREKIFMTLNMPKGIAMAVIVTLLFNLNLEGLKPILDLALLFLLYTMVCSTVVIKFSRYFLNTEVIK